jgi:hypothetical protein
LLYRLVPPHLRRLSWRLRLRFLYAMLFHTALVLTIAGGLVLAAVAAATGTAPVAANPWHVLLFWVAICAWLVPLTAVLRRRGLLRPADAPSLSWENWLYRLTRWPFIAWGVCAATLQLLRPRPVTIKVTPKVVDGLERLPARLIAPHVVLSVVLAAAALAGPRVTAYSLLCLLGALVCLVVPFTVCLLHAADTAGTAGARLGRAIGETVRVSLLVSALAIPPVIAGFVRAVDYFVQ